MLYWSHAIGPAMQGWTTSMQPHPHGREPNILGDLNFRLSLTPFALTVPLRETCRLSVPWYRNLIGGAEARPSDGREPTRQFHNRVWLARKPLSPSNAFPEGGREQNERKTARPSTSAGPGDSTMVALGPAGPTGETRSSESENTWTKLGIAPRADSGDLPRTVPACPSVTRTTCRLE